VDNTIELNDWAAGVIKALPADQLPANALSDGYNTAFVKYGLGKTAIGSRPGLNTINTTAFTNTPAIHRQIPYIYDNGSTKAPYLATFGDDGTLRYKQSDDTFTSTLTVPANFPSPSTLCFTAGSSPIAGAVLNNRLFVVNQASEKRSLINQTYVPWGLSPIATVAVSATGSGSSSMPAETYDVAVTSYNSTSGGESSANASVSVTLTANQRIKVDITPTSAESAQYSHWRVYLRRQTTQAVLYQVQTFENSGGTTIVTDANIPIATTSVYIDLSAATIAAHILVAPSTTENNGPPSGIRYVESFARRLIVATDDGIYWSKLDKGDNFPANNFEPISSNGGEELTGLAAYSDNILLVGFKNSVWAIYGTDPQTWSIRPLSLSIGVASHNSFVRFEQAIAWWSPTFGPVVFDGTAITDIGHKLLGRAYITDEINQSRLSYIQGAKDFGSDRILWTVSSVTSTVNDRLIPYNYEIKAFEATYWNPFNIASLGVSIGNDSVEHVYCGNYGGQVFALNANYRVDGVPSGTVRGTFTTTTTMLATITDASAAFYTTGTKLANRKVIITDADDAFVAERFISSNTSTVLTLDTSLTDLSLSTTYHYYIGGPNFQMYPAYIDFGQPFLRKRFDRLYVHFGSNVSVANITVATQIELDTLTDVAITDATQSETLWDHATWDVSAWAGGSSQKLRVGVFRNATSLRPSIFCFTPSRDIFVYKLTLLGRLLSDRYFG
jgi:hypothetical protein